MRPRVQPPPASAILPYLYLFPGSSFTSPPSRHHSFIAPIFLPSTFDSSPFAGRRHQTRAISDRAACANSSCSFMRESDPRLEPCRAVEGSFWVIRDFSPPFRMFHQVSFVLVLPLPSSLTSFLLYPSSTVPFRLLFDVAPTIAHCNLFNCCLQSERRSPLFFHTTPRVLSLV